MTKEDFDVRMSEITQEFDEKREKLWIEFAKSNNIVQVGDVVRDHTGLIKVEGAQVFLPSFSNYPCMRYVGTVLKKDGTLKKRERRRSVFQSNMVEINGKPYKYEE